MGTILTHRGDAAVARRHLDEALRLVRRRPRPGRRRLRDRDPGRADPSVLGLELVADRRRRPGGPIRRRRRRGRRGGVLRADLRDELRLPRLRPAARPGGVPPLRRGRPRPGTSRWLRDAHAVPHVRSRLGQDGGGRRGGWLGRRSWPAARHSPASGLGSSATGSPPCWPTSVSRSSGSPMRSNGPTKGWPRWTSSGERWFEAELHRLRGEALAGIDPADPDAEAAFRAGHHHRRRSGGADPATAGRGQPRSRSSLT